MLTAILFLRNQLSSFMKPIMGNSSSCFVFMLSARFINIRSQLIDFIQNIGSFKHIFAQ